ncbi:MAG: glycine oxidase ThiO [Blastocatellia bacterium]
MPLSRKQYDTAIIGGGVIGTAIAWRLAQARQRVIVIERHEPGAEASFAAGGILGPMAEAGAANDFFRLGVKSREMYAGFARELLESTGVDIEYRAEGTLFLALTDADEEELERRWHWQHAAGLNVKRLTAACTRKLETAINGQLRWALKFPDDHQVNNHLLMAALLRAAQMAGVEILPHTEARRLLMESHAGQSHIHGIETSAGTIHAPTVVLAAGSWSGLLTGEINSGVSRFRTDPVRGQMMALENTVPPLRHVIFSGRGYLVPRRSGAVIAGSTTERVGYDKRVTDAGLATVLATASEIAPDLAAARIIETWAGLRPKGPDSRPALGAHPAIAGLVYATAHYRNGILLTPVTAMAISELITRGASSYDISSFSVSRFASPTAAG